MNVTGTGEVKGLVVVVWGGVILENWALVSKPSDDSSDLTFLLHLCPVILNI